MPIPVINTKLFTPSTRTNRIKREALIELLNKNNHIPFILVSAPAGFGKSSLIASWFTQEPFDSGWLSLDESDNNPISFFTHFLTGLQRLELCSDELLLMLNTPQANQTEGYFKQLIIRLINELSSLNQPVLFTFDDFHIIDNEQIINCIQFFLDNIPPLFRCILISREDPSFSLSKYRANNTMLEIRAYELRLNESECMIFLNEMMALSLSEEQVRALHEKTEGWPVGLQLAALSLKNVIDIPQFIDEFTGSNRYILDYLVEEVLENLSHNQRNFLADVCFLPRFNSELCDHIRDDSDSTDIIDFLVKNNFFIIALDENRYWYRFHHLFSDMLKTQLKKPISSKLYHRASQWFSDQKQPLEAIHYALLSKDSYYSLKLIEMFWPDLRSDHPETILIDWLSQIDDSIIQQHPVVMVHWGMALANTNIHKSKSVITELEKRLAKIDKGEETSCIINNQDEFNCIWGITYVAKAYHAGVNSQYDQILAYSKQAIHTLNNAKGAANYPSRMIWTAAAYATLSIALMNTGELHEALSVIQASIELIAIEHSSSVIAMFTLAIGIQLSMGELSQAQKSCEDALTLIDQNFTDFLPEGTADIYSFLADIAISQNHILEAETLLQKNQNMDVYTQLAELKHYRLIVATKIAWSKDEFALANQYLDQAKKVKSISPIQDSINLDALHCLLSLYEKKWPPQNRLGWIDSLNTDEPKVNSHNEQQYITYGILSLIQSIPDHSLSSLTYRNSLPFKEDTLETAISIFNSIKHSSQQGGRHQVNCEATLLLALSYSEKDNSLYDQSISVLISESIDLAQKHNYQRLLIDTTRLFTKIAQLIQFHCPNASIVTLIENNDNQAEIEQNQANTELNEPLSEREIQVLNMLNTDLSGPQIADKLYISINTLRTHTKKIYLKLNTNDRRSTLAEAKRLGLIS